MPPERFPPDDPREWLRWAELDLGVAGLAPPEMAREPFCFHAQQAAEKAIKSVLLVRGVRFPFTHDLAQLLDLVEQDGVRVPDEILDAGHLTDFAVLARYPTEDMVTEAEFRMALKTAEAVVRWARMIIGTSTDA